MLGKKRCSSGGFGAWLRVCVYTEMNIYVYVNEKRKRNDHFEGEVEGLFKLLPRAL